MGKKKAARPLVYNNPARFACQDDRNVLVDKVALGLDLGTNCGYAYSIIRPDGTWDFQPWYMGLWDLSTGRYDSGNLGFLRLRCFLTRVCPDIVFMEEVRYTPAEAVNRYNAARIVARAATSAELLGAFKQTVSLWCNDHDVHCAGIPIGTIKKRATGRGNANKTQMIEACNEEFQTNFDVEGYETTGVDNIADAAWVLRCGLEEYGDGRL